MKWNLSVAKTIYESQIWCTTYDVSFIDILHGFHQGFASQEFIRKDRQKELLLILCKLNKGLLESSKAVGLHKQKTVGLIECEKMFCLLCDFQIL